MSLGPTPEKGPAGIQERLRGTVPWSRLGNPDPTGGSGVGGRGAYDVSGVSCLDSLGLLYPRLVSSPDAGSPKKRVASGRWPPAAEVDLKGAGGWGLEGWLLTSYSTAGQLVLLGKEVWAAHLYMFLTPPPGESYGNPVIQGL